MEDTFSSTKERCVTSRILLRALEQIVPKTHHGKTRQLHKAGRHQLIHQLTCGIPRSLSHCRTGCHVERIATAREEVLPSLPPATLAQCATLAFLLHAVIAKVWHSPIGPPMLQVYSVFTWFDTIGAR